MRQPKTNTMLLITLAALIGRWGTSPARAQETSQAKASALPEGYSCLTCHSKKGDLWTDQIPVAEETALSGDTHWKKGLRCHDCHGGSPTLDEFKNHRDDPDFHSVRSRELIPGFCGRCHSSITYMRRFNPSARTDQESEYWTSGHGRRLKTSVEQTKGTPDPAVAVCNDCHGGHGILAVKDPSSPVDPTRVAQTCSHCHSDPKRMANRLYNGRPLSTNQYEQWLQGVHGQAMFKKGDRSAATCNDCHGNHGAMPPGIDSVANACGTCHSKVAKLFAETRMKHRFEEVGLPGCATCHGAHRTTHPSDLMLGMEQGSVCSRCHNSEHPQYGATTTGAVAARAMRTRFEELKNQIQEAEREVREAEHRGMEVRGPRYDLRQAADALTNARTLIHSFRPEPVDEAITVGLGVTTSVKSMAEQALREHQRRRIWLAASLVPLLLVVCLLLLYIRSLQFPAAK